METNKKLKSVNISGVLKTVTLAVVLSLLLIGGAVYAWSGATWHDPATWISNGKIIRADLMGESLQYLYDHLGGGTDTLSNLNCSEGQIIKWNGSSWNCVTSTCVTPPPPVFVPTPVKRSGSDVYYQYQRI